MRVSAKSDYAVRALIEIARNAAEQPVRAEEIGRLQDIPKGFLQAILADLRKADILLSQRGQSGGWRFARRPAEVSLADVIRAVDGPLVSVYGVRPESVEYNATARGLQDVWVAARTSLRDVLEHVSIADLVEGSLPAAVTSRTADEDAWQAH
jgi:Rrf2 family protein